MALISNLSVGINANMRGLDKGLAKTRKKIKGFVKKIGGIKTGIAAALGGAAIGAVLAKSLGAWKEQEQAVASLEAANESMGRSSIGITEAMIKQAGELQKTGVLGDEAIIQGQAFLSTFSQIPDKLLPRATVAMADLMVKAKKSGQAAANIIGKAAMGNVGALSIAGITLSETTLAAAKAQKAMASMAEKAGISLRGLGDDGKLFQMILADIESQIGGTNIAIGKTASGGIDQFNNALSDMNEDLGKIVTSGISPWARQLAVEMDLISINTDDMGASLKKSMIGGIENIAPFVNALNGIKLAFKVLELGLAGFELAAITVFRGLATGVSAVGGFFGIDTAPADEALRGLNKDFTSQLSTVAKIKEEIGSLYDDVENKQLGKDFIAAARAFDERAVAGVEALKKPIQPKVLGAKPVNQFSINSTGGGDVRPLFPKVDRTNALLEQILNNGSNTAVAG